jgi:putative phosphoribosyl transferase
VSSQPVSGGGERAPPRRTGAVVSPVDPPVAAPEALGFRDRHDAGRRLAALLMQLRPERPVVLGIPRGGVPVAAEVARALGAPLDVTVVRKIGAPQNPEYAIGAVAEGGVHVLSEEAARALGLGEAQRATLVARGEEELRARLRRYRGARPPLAVAGRTAIVVDDGLATGRTALAAVRSVRRRGAARVVLAAPVCARRPAQQLSDEADEVACVELPSDLWAVGYWYADFTPTSDEEVAALLSADVTSGDVAAGDETPGQ